jgi:V/A-type H+-transporting ATPase subunit B
MEAELTLTGAADRLEGPLLFLERRVEVGLGEAVEVIGRDRRARLGRVSALDDERMVVEILETTRDLALGDVRVRFLGEPMRLGVGPGLLGRVFDGVGEPIDGGPPVPAAERRPVGGVALNPAARALPSDFIETGVTAIDLMNSLVRGQKLPVFSGGGLPHDRLAIDIAERARLLDEEAGNFAIVFAGIGVSHATAERFRSAVAESGAQARTTLFLTLADESAVQRLLTPRTALTAAEYLAFTEGRHVLVILTDMTNYCEGLREVSASHGEVPARKGYPGYMYSDLASIYERAGRIDGRSGTLTQLPVLTMPGDDISHPIPDLTGYITEGQIVLGRDLDRQGIYPPVEALSSLSRLMDEGVGEGRTDPDHADLASQLFAAYSRATHSRTLASVVGEAGLPETDRRYLRFGDAFERELVHQEGGRSLADSLGVGWRLLEALPSGELSRLSDDQIERHLGGQAAEEPDEAEETGEAEEEPTGSAPAGEG